MATVDITINNRIYKVTCDAGQEERLQTLSKWADDRLQMIAGEVGQIGDTRLMLLTLLMVCDELLESREASGNGDDFSTTNAATAKDAKAKELIAETTERIRQLTNALDG